MNRPPVELHVVSDSTGETAAKLAKAVEDQFPDLTFDVIRHPRLTSLDDVLVMAEDKSVRANRLRLLLDVRDAVGMLGDLSQIPR